MERDRRLEDLSGVYREMDNDRKKKMEKLAEGLLKVQLIVESEKKEKTEFRNEKCQIGYLTVI
ncbi:hypothetical protein AGMMS4952_24560 [Spirochaetia bacterium]|nr:hypothetical protein AGMMS4952_24560 [Spirochaetia bacterium]